MASGSAVIALVYLMDFKVLSELPEISVSHHLLPSREKGRNGTGFCQLLSSETLAKLLA